MDREKVLKVIGQEMQELAEIICDRYCKYGEEYTKDCTNGETKTFMEHCIDCPLISWFTN